MATIAALLMRQRSCVEFNRQSSKGLDRKAALENVFCNRIERSISMMIKKKWQIKPDRSSGIIVIKSDTMILGTYATRV